MNSTIAEPVSTSYSHWKEGWCGDLLICLCVGSLLLIGPLIASWHDGWRMEISPLHLMPDSSVYLGMIKRASLGTLSGDPFIWEHRNDPASVLSFYHFWLNIYGWLVRQSSLGTVVSTSFLLSSLWFFVLVRFCRALGQPRPYALFTAGLATFFAVNLAYNIIGYRARFGSWNLWLTEHLRIYPSLTSMAIYSTAIWLIFEGLKTRLESRIQGFILILSGGLVGLTVFGRPYDWLVLLLMLLFLGLTFIIRRDWKRLLIVGSIATVGLIVSFYFLIDYFAYRSTHGEAYMDQLARGNLHVKLISHYAKYGLAAGITGFGMICFLAGWPKKRCWIEMDDARLFLLCLIAASLLAHFHTLKDRITLVGFSYLFVFSIFPWVTLGIMHGIYLRLMQKRPQWFFSKGWIGVLLVLLITQQMGLGLRASIITSRWKISDDQIETYRQLSSHAFPEDVVLGMVGSGELIVMTNCYSFLPHPIVASYVCSAPTTELLDRYLLTKLLFTGTVSDLQALFDPQGVLDVDIWTSKISKDTRRWFDLLAESIGRNYFILHPQRNAADLTVRKLKLPHSLQDKNGFVIYFDDALRSVFKKAVELEKISAAESKGSQLYRILTEICSRYRLNYILLNAGNLNVRNRFRDSHDLKLVFQTSTCELWKLEVNRSIAKLSL